MQFRIWRKSIEDERLKKILCQFGGDVTDATEWSPGDYDAEVIFGSWKNRNVEHHNLKRSIVENSKNVIVMESPLLGRQKVAEVLPDEWFRVGLNGFMSNAQYPKVNNSRFQKILAEAGVGENLKMATNRDGDYVLVVLQLPGDASLNFIDINAWAKETVESIRSITDRDIVIRFPQLPRQFDVEFTKSFKGIYFQHGTHTDKQITLDNAYAVVTYSSGMGVEAILSSRRTLIDSPNGFFSRKSTLQECLTPNYENFESITKFDQWLDLVTSTQWHVSEIESGECHEKFEELINV